MRAAAQRHGMLRCSVVRSVYGCAADRARPLAELRRVAAAQAMRIAQLEAELRRRDAAQPGASHAAMLCVACCMMCVPCCMMCVAFNMLCVACCVMCVTCCMIWDAVCCMLNDVCCMLHSPVRCTLHAVCTGRVLHMRAVWGKLAPARMRRPLHRLLPGAD
jgi:hypothetical protein